MLTKYMDPFYDFFYQRKMDFTIHDAVYQAQNTKKWLEIRIEIEQ